MSKKKTPREKKSAAYEKDHYTFTWHSPHGFRKTWKKKKRRLNHVVRRKSRAMLQSVGGLNLDELTPEQESFTDQLFRKGLSKKRLFKRGAVSLRQKVEQKIKDRESHVGFNTRSKARQKEGFRRFCINLLTERKYSEENIIRLNRLAHFPDFQAFLQGEPHWISKLERWILSASKRIAWEKINRASDSRKSASR